MKRNVAKILTVACLALVTTTAFSVSYEGGGITICPNSGVKCDVTTELDGKKVTVSSEKGKNDGAVIQN